MTKQDNANAAAGQRDSRTDDGAGQGAPGSGDAERTPTSETDDTHTADQDDTANDDGSDYQDDDRDGGNPANEAKRYRLRLRGTERERDELRDTLARTRQAIVDNAVQTVGLDPRLLAAAGHTLDSLVGDDGLIDPAKLSEAVTATAQEFRVTPKGRPPAPNPQQGRPGPAPKGKASWSKALKGD
ncbi:UNVERIFIED_ORG: hypothetical protein GGE11_001443 [Mycolicibacterium obuense]